MRKILLGALLLLSTLSFGQTDFKWEKVDSIQKSKDQLYTDTKLFISDYWKSSKDVIQNDDREGGVVTIKGIIKVEQKINFTGSATFYFNFSITYLFKDGKYKVILDNVNCQNDVWFMGNINKTIKPLPISDVNPVGYEFRAGKGELKEDKYREAMSNLKTQLQSIMDDYNTYIKKPSIKSGW